MRGVEQLKNAVDSETGKYFLKSKAAKGVIGFLFFMSAVDASDTLLDLHEHDYKGAFNALVHHETAFAPAVALLLLRKRAQEIGATQIQPETEYVIGQEPPVSQTFLPPEQEASL